MARLAGRGRRFWILGFQLVFLIVKFVAFRAVIVNGFRMVFSYFFCSFFFGKLGLSQGLLFF